MDIEDARLTVNGRPYPPTAGLTVAILLGAAHKSPGAVVVEVNGVIISRDRFAETALKAGDCVEIVHFVGGG